MTGSGNVMFSRMIGVVLVAERVASERLLEANGGGDATCVDRIHLFALVGVHHQHAADALAFALVEL